MTWLILGVMSAQHCRGRVWLDVPYDDKDMAKALGARWDGDERRWYAGPRAHPDLVARWPGSPELPITLPGEDRSFGTGLFIDLIPQTSWFSNIRSSIDGADWERLRRMLRRRAEERCELCGRGEYRAGRRWLEAHERFAYDPGTGVQALRRLVLLCSDCHEVTHFGLAHLNGRGETAFAHLRAVTRMTVDDALAHVEEAFALWKARSRQLWSLDLSPLTKAGITVARPPEPANRARAAEKQTRQRRTPVLWPEGRGPADSGAGGGRDEGGGPGDCAAADCGCSGDPEPGVTVRAVTWDEAATSNSPIAAILRGDSPDTATGDRPTAAAPAPAGSPDSRPGRDDQQSWWRRWRRG